MPIFPTAFLSIYDQCNSPTWLRLICRLRADEKFCAGCGKGSGIDGALDPIFSILISHNSTLVWNRKRQIKALWLMSKKYPADFGNHWNKEHSNLKNFNLRGPTWLFTWPFYLTGWRARLDVSYCLFSRKILRRNLRKKFSLLMECWNGRSNLI